MLSIEIEQKVPWDFYQRNFTIFIVAQILRYIWSL